MLYLISYDIAVDKRRTRIAKILEGFGQRVQYSVFECDLTAKQYSKLRGKLHKVLRPADGDNLRTYRLCGVCAPHTEIVGNGPTLETSVTIYIF
ncbi:CRISPR-associated endonuclease Cas2 [Herpetosiphon giganteus]|uniref:CRISPR-associated endonuclease Cas2 n=1 Tax=Herpetosiphon giganteus TaxID=2029754 RepID=UPI0019572D6E|nr:CRISPR-associated endonuclease Cas2 [Herpetosiphon giganteus]MBM7846596.1 CRISPR-associated protein Cas2 [Herpetosiphon giganteus]